MAEHETVKSTFQTLHGEILVTKVYEVRRESYSGQNQIVAKRLDQVEFEAGEWLTDEMADELAAYLRNPRLTPPAWLTPN